jgi:hypothetical protein
MRRGSSRRMLSAVNSVSAERPVEAGMEETEGKNMKKVLLAAALVLGVTMTVVGPEAPRTGSPVPALGPQEVVEVFYGDYLSYIGAGDTLRNPLAEGMYRESPYLAASFVTHVDRLVAGFKDGGFDPFLLAQDVPERVIAGEAIVTGNTAVVPVTTSFQGHHYAVNLAKQTDGRWLITSITPGL